MFSIAANTMYTIDENGKHSLEISYCDSDGTNVGAYSEGDTFESVIFDAVDQIDEAIAEFDDDQADVQEAEALQAQIAELQAQINELQARNTELEKRHAEKLSHKPALDIDLKSFINNLQKKEEYKKFAKDDHSPLNKISDFPFGPNWWA